MDGTDYELNHWQQINDLFVAARARPPEERGAFLHQACADHPALRAEVESLLTAYDASDDDFLHEIDLDQAAALIESVGEPGGQQIGPYRVVREIGQGGMGAVYLAERADGQFDQQVALKLIKRGMDSEAILRRFLHERQILARLQHVNIARLLDGGVSDDGRPYFAMEYVEGVPLTAYCDTRQLDVEARLRLFEQVCRAVHYAHTNLVVHRDLKPSNMLVTEDGELKLLDFGIAKLLGGEEKGGVTTLTEAGLRAMTPEYAAPEQVRGEAVTTATDVYALGVVLYELLTGHRPYQFERRTPEAVAQVISEAEPARPSTAVSQSTDVRRSDGTTETITPEGVSRARSTQPERLQRRLRGDLDVVVLKALRKEPSRKKGGKEPEGNGVCVEKVQRVAAGPIAGNTVMVDMEPTFVPSLDIAADVWVIPNPLDLTFEGFAPAAFAILERLREHPHIEQYRREKEDINRYITEPFKRFRDDLVVNWALPNRMDFETEKNVFSRLLKNDFGAGGCHHHLWMSFYRPARRRLTDTQLSHSITPKGFSTGLFVGDYAKALLQQAKDRIAAEPGRFLELINPLLQVNKLGIYHSLRGQKTKTFYEGPLDALPLELPNATGFFVRSYVCREEALVLEGGLVRWSLERLRDLWPVYRFFLNGI